MGFDKMEIKTMVRPLEYEEKGCIRAQIKDDLYPGIKIKSVTPKYYYHKKYHEENEYSKKILDTKITNKDESVYFIPFVDDCLDKFEDDLHFSSVDLISIIPNSVNKYYPNIIKIAKHVEKKLKKPSRSLFNRINSSKSVSRARLSRYKYLSGNFPICKGVDVDGKRVLLIDDIRTSGITALECAKVLLESGAKEVILFALGTNSSRKPTKKRGEIYGSG